VERDRVTLLPRVSELETTRSAAELAVARADEEARSAREELVAVRRKARELGSRVGRAEEQQAAAEAAREALRRELEQERERHAALERTLRDRLADAERALNEARQAQREGAKGDQLRLRLLLDAVVNAATGLRRELALPPAHGRPADAIEADYARTGRVELQGRTSDDPALLDALLAVPMTHVLVDGYNVTKTGYPALSLEAQRTRLLGGLGALAARTQAEVTVVFDGATGAVPVKLPAPRGVRLLFSRTGETADEVLRRLAQHEPRGRPVVVVSSDREVADGVREAGATAVPSLALLRLLDRSVGPPS
jgi:predicted RNA-binding protein with PIN domain